MKKRRIIALTVAVLAVGVFVPVADDIWKALAYEYVQKGEMGSFNLSYIERWEKRVSWLPGPDVIAHPQVCGRCETGNHANCVPTISRTLVTAGGYQCTCPDADRHPALYSE